MINGEEKEALDEIKKVEEEIKNRLDLTRKEAEEIIAASRKKATVLIRKKESELAELRQSFVQSEFSSLEPEKELKHDLPPSPADLVSDLAQKLLELLLHKPNENSIGPNSKINA